MVKQGTARSLCDLPEELILEVLEHNIYRRQDLASLSLTCKKVRRIIEPLLYRHVELRRGLLILPFLVRTLLIRPELGRLVNRLDVDGAGETLSDAFELEHWSKAFNQPPPEGGKSPEVVLLESAYESRSEASRFWTTLSTFPRRHLLHYPMFNLLLFLLPQLDDLRLVSVPSCLIRYPGIRHRERYPEVFGQHAFNSVAKVAYRHCPSLAVGYSEPWASDIPNVKEISVDPESLPISYEPRLAFPLDNIQRIQICHNYYERRNVVSLIKQCRNLRNLGISFEFPWHFSNVGSETRVSRCIPLLVEALLDRADTLEYLGLKFCSNSRIHFQMKNEDMAPAIKSLGKLEKVQKLEIPAWMFELNIYSSPNPKDAVTAVVQSLLPASLENLVLNNVYVPDAKFGTALDMISSNARDFWPRLKEIHITESAKECPFKTESQFRASGVGKLVERCLKDSGIMLSFETPNRDRDLERVCCYPKGLTM